MKVFVFFLFFFFLSIPARLDSAERAVQVNKPLDVVINEIAWMGTNISSWNEWIELFNNTNQEVDLNDWTLRAVSGALNITFGPSIIPARGYFLLERVEKATDIPGDLIYKGKRMSNKGEKLELRDNKGQLVDSVDCAEKWFAGEASPGYFTMERINSLSVSDTDNWGTSQNSGGTPKIKNSVTAKIEVSQEKPATKLKPEPTPELSEIALPIIEVQPQLSGIVINEILPSPEGPDAKEEYIEIFNQNDFEVNVSNWQITDTIGKTKTYTFPEETAINPQGFLVFYRPIIKITLNNKEDEIILTHPNGDIADRVSYKSAPLGQSYNRTNAGWVWSPFLTPGSSNIIPVLEPKKKLTETTEGLSLLTQNDLTEDKTHIKTGLAIPSRTVSSPFPLFVSITALVSALFSGAIILFLKKGIKTN